MSRQQRQSDFNKNGNNIDNKKNQKNTVIDEQTETSIEDESKKLDENVFDTPPWESNQSSPNSSDNDNEDIFKESSADAQDIPFQKNQETENVSDTATPQAPILEIIETSSAEKKLVEEQLLEKNRINDINSKLSPGGKTILFGLNTYIEKCAPAIPYPDPKSLANQQASLAKHINNIVNNLDDNDFTLLWNELLHLFFIHRDGVFSDVMVYRVPEYIPLSYTERENFNRLLNLLLVTRNPDTRVEALKTLNWGYTLQYASELGRQRLIHFYDITV